jgi:hypothetical protein
VCINNTFERAETADRDNIFFVRESGVFCEGEGEVGRKVNPIAGT